MEIKENTRYIFQRLSESGDQSAFWRLHSCFFPRLFRLVYSITSHTKVAEELASDVFPFSFLCK